MFFKEKIEEIGDTSIRIYIDMDGVLADYDIGKAYSYDTKRPLYTSIQKLEEVFHMKNVEMYILSVTRMDSGISEKNTWLDQYVPFIKKENRIILSREKYNFERTAVSLKTDFFRELSTSDKVVLIDDDPQILHTIRKEVPDIILFKDTVLID